jgi:UDP-N-acetylmuramate dehydrogenase
VENSVVQGEGENPGLLAAVRALVGDRVRRNVPASSLTTFAIGGDISYLVTIESLWELQAVMKLLTVEGQPARVLGFGSNVLIADRGIQGWVLRLGQSLRSVEHSEGDRFVIAGGASLMTVARKISADGFSGLEFAAGIPASVGGAVFMNAGAHGAEIADRIERVSLVMPDGSFRVYDCKELPFTYRHSGLPRDAAVISVELLLPSGDKERIARTCSENLAHRKNTQPLSLPSAGSVFKNPSPDLPAGKVLEQAGLKGTSVGGAEISSLHANWIVNPDKRASAADVLALISLCQERVRSQMGIELEPEVRLW